MRALMWGGEGHPPPVHLPSGTVHMYSTRTVRIDVILWSVLCYFLFLKEEANEVTTL